MIRAALWFVGLFALAVAVALFTSNNQAIVSLFWQSTRIDFSLNSVLLLLVAAFTLCYAAIRGMSALFHLPLQAKRWRQLKKERQMYQALIDSLSHLQAGRYLRARKSADMLIKLSDELRDADAKFTEDSALRAIAHMLAADSAHALRDVLTRNKHYEQALQDVPANGTAQQIEVRESAQMRAARWALDDHEPEEALFRLQQLPAGASRRTMALRIQLKANRLAQQTRTALETARLLTKHQGISAEAANSIIRGLTLELLRNTHDSEQLERTWQTLTDAERTTPDTALAAAKRMLQLQGQPQLARKWLLPVWESFVEKPGALSEAQTQQLFVVMSQALDGLDASWLSRIEVAYQSTPQELRLQYLAGMACMQHQLWGKAEQLLTGAVQRLSDTTLRTNAWKALAILAEQREDSKAALHAWRQAAQQVQSL